jgi:transposase
MFGLTGNLKIFLAVEPADMRKSFNGLHALVVEKLKENPMDKALFVFCNKSRNRIKMLHFDGTGLWIMAKRLEQGTFSWAKGVDVENGKLALTPEALSLLLDGVDLKSGKMRPWYQRDT